VQWLLVVLLLVAQWCSRDRNLRDRDRDLVKISRRDRDFIKNSETETETRDLKFETETETSKSVHFAEIFQKNVAITSDHGRPHGGNGHFRPWDWNHAPRFSRKHEVSSSIPISWLNFCNSPVFSGMTLTLRNSQVPCSGVMQCWACLSLMFTPLRGQTCERIFSSVGVYCVTISRQQIFKDSLQVTVEGVSPLVAFEH